MNYKKLLILLNICFVLLLTGCINLSASSKPYNCDVSIKSISLKIALIETAYEMYNVNIGNTAYFNENLYKDTSEDAYEYYLWLKSTYNNMDSSMKNILNDMFVDYDDLDYINTVIDLDDNTSIDELINVFTNDISLNLSNNLKTDVPIFLNYFYENSLKPYIEYNEDKYIEKSEELNEKLLDNKVSINEFVEKTYPNGINYNYDFIMYYSLSPIKTSSFSSDNIFINTINLDTSLIDIVGVCLYDYSKTLFSTIKNTSDFLNTCDLLKEDENLMKMYNDTYKDYYNFEYFCLLNLISGFSKYLDFKYFGSTYENVSYVYDLDFYNYLKNLQLDTDNINLQDISIDFYNSILN